MLAGCPSMATARRFRSSRSIGRPCRASQAARPATIAAAEEPQPAASGSSVADPAGGAGAPARPQRQLVRDPDGEAVAVAAVEDGGDDEVRGVGRQLVEALAG